MWVMYHDIGFADFMDIIPKAQATKSKNLKIDYIKTKKPTQQREKNQ